MWLRGSVSALKIVCNPVESFSTAVTVLWRGWSSSSLPSAFLCPSILMSDPHQQQWLSLCCLTSPKFVHAQITSPAIHRFYLSGPNLQTLLPAHNPQPGNCVPSSSLGLFINAHLRVLCVCVLWKPHLFPWRFLLHQFLSVGPWLITWLLKACECTDCSCLFVFLPVWLEKPALSNVCY